MPFTRWSRGPRLWALAGAVLLTASPAAAHSGHSFSISLSSYATNAYSNMTMSFVFGQVEPDVITIDFPPSWPFATTGVSPSPDDEESIGSGLQKASWTALFCMTASQATDWTWEEDMTGAPVGTVGRWVMSDTFGSTTLWVIEENGATDDYKLTMDLDQTRTCSSASQPTDATLTIALAGTTPSGGHVHRNPATAGCYTVTASVTEAGTFTTHTGSVTVPIGGASC